MSSNVIRCDRCNRRLRNPKVDCSWNVTMEAGRIIGYTCPSCQTVEENAEAVINEATLDYCGRIPGVGFIAHPKGASA